ncbi:MAG: hypothetical protein KDA21_11555, partial [Phycisphaerales bacterium]|nr:hypothetical protein [Phycisphaerales bacterium]
TVRPTGIVNDLDMLNEVKQGLDLLDGTLVSLDLPAGPEMAFKARIPVDGVMVTLNLHPHSVRSELYEVRVQLADGSY